MSPFQSLRAQSDTLWTRTYGGIGWDEGSSVEVTADGGFVVVGRTASFSAGNSDVYLIRTDANGDTLWTRTYGGSSDDYGSSVQVTADGGFVVAGRTDSFGAGNADVYLIRTDANGDTLWTRTYGGSSIDYGSSVQITADGGFVVAGHTYTSRESRGDVYLIRTDANGDTLWTRAYGGSRNDYGSSVQVTADGGFVVAGRTDTFGAGKYDVYLIRTDANGDTLWTRTYGGRNDDYGSSVQVTADGGFVLAGTTFSSGGVSSDVYLIRTDANGDTLWTRAYGGSRDDYGRSVQGTDDGGFVVAGSKHPFNALDRDFWLIRTGANGDMLWTRTYGGTYGDRGSSVQVTADGGFVAVGYSVSFGAGSGDVYLIRLAPESPLAIKPGRTLTPHALTLDQNYPNPFNPSTNIQFNLPMATVVTLILYNILGQEITRLVGGYLMPGYHRVIWDGNDGDGRDLPAGIYIVRLETPGYAKTIKMVLLK